MSNFLKKIRIRTHLFTRALCVIALFFCAFVLPTTSFAYTGGSVYDCGYGGEFPMTFAGCRSGYYYEDWQNEDDSLGPDEVGECIECPTGYECAGGFAGPVASSVCATGYYGVSAESCTACTNKPAHSTYTGAAQTNTCPWTCDSGYVNGGSSCETEKFSITTTNLSAGTEFTFGMSASGVFYIDWGDGTGETIDRTGNTDFETYSHTYTTGGVKTIGFGGTATGYNTDTSTAAISFSRESNYSAEKIASISGNLSSMFPYISGNTASGAQPRFSSTFRGATNLAEIPDTLFASYTTGAQYMFYFTFQGCTGLTSIPGNLFSGITTGAQHMFYFTFHGCTGLTSIPGNLFSGITTGAQYMFSGTFQGCTGLTSIPGTLFAGITTGAQYMFFNTFYGCTGLTSIPGNLFSGITTGASSMFFNTFQNCTGLTSIPGTLFSGITTGASGMFNQTFASCTGLTSIPGNLFSGITTGASNMFTQTFSGCTGLTSIPGTLFSGITTGAAYMFSETFYGCTGLTSIPGTLFSGITTGAGLMFKATFYGCTNITGYIPPSTFKTGMGSYSNMWQNTFYNTQLVTSCPAGTTQYITGYEGSTDGTTWNGKVSCEQSSALAVTLDSTDTTTAASPSTVYLNYMDGWYSDSNATTEITAITTLPTKTNSIFGGYYTEQNCSGTQVIDSNGNFVTTAPSLTTATIYPCFADTKFSLTTTNYTSTGGTFQFSLSATGTFYVDCGADGTLSGTGVDGKTITRTNTIAATYTCTYSSTGAKTIRFGGTATGYNTGISTAAISFYNLGASKIASISGNLSTIFPYISSSSAPKFYRTFYGAINLAEIPDTLFASYTTGAHGMFAGTFQVCTGLTSIPGNLFSGITTGAESMFFGTFHGCTGLTSIPGNLFSGITTGASGMFYSTFNGCTGLTSIPGTLFSGITTGASNMFVSTFYGCTGLTSIPGTLFSGITTGASNMFVSTFSGCTGLTSIPGNLFSGITTGANSMFTQTFYGCTNITGYIPPSTFKTGMGSYSNMWQNTFRNTQLVTSCPAGTTQYITGYEGSTANTTWNGKVSCEQSSILAVTLDSTDTTTAASPSTVYLNYMDGWYSDSNATTEITAITTLPTKTNSIFGGYYTEQNCSGTQVIDFNGNFVTTAPSLTTATIYPCFADTKFSLTTTNYTSTGGTFQFSLSANGTFYVDCGADGTLSGTGVDGKTITRTNTTAATYTCTYSSTGAKTIRFGGTATGYNTNTSTAAISFNNLGASKIASISGNLSSMFPYISGNTASGAQPRFYRTFNGATNLAEIPDILFSNYTTGASNMFNSTFHGCTGLTSIPGNLFSGITTGAGSMFRSTFSGCTGLTSILGNLFSGITTGATYMFEYTFLGCTGLTSIPGNLFSGITTGAGGMFTQTFSGCTGLTSIPGTLFSGITTGAGSMFTQTFSGCTGLTSIPGNLFSGITTGASGMFTQTFYGCTGLTSIPGTLFSGITTGATYMFNQTFYGCTGLTSIPGNLFNGITTGAAYMFSYTFSGCTNITGYIPPSTFKTGMGRYSDMWSDTFADTQLVTSCPAGTTQYITGYEGSTANTTWNGYVSCQYACPAGQYLPANANACTTCPTNSYCAGGNYETTTSVDQGIQSCPNSWYSPMGMSSVDQCGRVLHIGDNVVYLRSVKKTTPALHVKIGDDIFYGNMTVSDVVMNSETERKLKLQYDGQTYSVYDDTVGVD